MTDSELHEIENHVSWGWHDDKGNDDVQLLINEVKRLRTVAAEARKEGIGEIPLRALLDWYMCSDPWPVLEPYQNQETVTEWLDGVCKASGYKDWVEAYHKMPAERLKEKGK